MTNLKNHKSCVCFKMITCLIRLFASNLKNTNCSGPLCVCVCADVSESLKEVEKVNISEQPLPSVEQPLPSSVGQPLPSVEQPLPSKQGLSDISTMPTATTKSSQSTKPVTVAREESPPPPPPPSTTGAVAMATNSPHYASTSTSYSQSPSGAPAPGSEGYSAYLQVRIVTNLKLPIVLYLP